WLLRPPSNQDPTRDRHSARETSALCAHPRDGRSIPRFPIVMSLEFESGHRDPDRESGLGISRGAAMARPARLQPTEGELEILKVLWDEGPSELKQVCAGLRRNRPVATTTVATMLKLMQGKGLVGRAEAGRGSVYAARLSREAVSTSLVRRLMDLVFDG